MSGRSIDNPLIVALDVSGTDRALELVAGLKGKVGLFKVGLQLYTAAGPEVARSMVRQGEQVFLDLKLHDIPHTAAQAAVEGARLGVKMMTLHALGGERMMAGARNQVDERSRAEGWTAPLLLGVTLLTSMNSEELAQVGLQEPLEENVVRLARCIRNAGLDGIVASPRELRLLREAGLKELLLVTPGIRAAAPGEGGLAGDDQARTMSAGEAIREGAHYLVVGRPITQSGDPAARAQELLAEIRRARMSR